eukprot:gb/GFBE01023199.1/.p1 GENE.gb/GFBE01023199.1/~~gb/GFBE01023199.1/.p1  ORF type:complete len:368 (+),score=57.41 gb/GFBE01023199.1/:1-1104(+)
MSLKRAISFGAILSTMADSWDVSLSEYSFEAYMSEFSKVYASVGETAWRREVFAANLAKIVAHNRAYDAGKYTWWLTVNHLTDWSEAEFRRLRSTVPGLSDEQAEFGINTTASSDRVDWRDQGVVTPVNDQGPCGSCWAFSAAETLESHLAIATGELVALSTQTLVNCVSNPQGCGGGGGCKGATMELAFEYVKSHGLPARDIEPYVRHRTSCKALAPAVRAREYAKLPQNDAAAIAAAVATKGPVSVIVAATTWQLYGGGIFKGCSRPLPSLGNELDHGVQLIGYGSENGHRYWLVRNSWGKWGEDGYIRISRESDGETFTDDSPREGVACKPYPKTQTVGGECGILFDASYPVGVSRLAPPSIAV